MPKVLRKSSTSPVSKPNFDVIHLWEYDLDENVILTQGRIEVKCQNH